MRWQRKDQLLFHIGGDAAISEVLAIMESMKVDWSSLHPRFEHGDDLDRVPAYAERLKKLGIIVVQPPCILRLLKACPPNLSRAKASL
ncbi:MAG: hypothetical protein KF870_13485 [Leadbetterella sp.]|nr:hypothetical protein [Leadbetterella sp.]